MHVYSSGSGKIVFVLVIVIVLRLISDSIVIFPCAWLILTDFVSEPSNALEIFDSIFKACKDQKLKDELLKALSTDSVCPDVIRAKVFIQVSGKCSDDKLCCLQANVLKMVEEMKGISEVMQVLLHHCCSILLDVESVQILVEKICEDIHNPDDCITDDDDKAALKKLQLLKVIIVYCLLYLTQYIF